MFLCSVCSVCVPRRMPLNMGLSLLSKRLCIRRVSVCLSMNTSMPLRISHFGFLLHHIIIYDLCYVGADCQLRYEVNELLLLLLLLLTNYAKSFPAIIMKPRMIMDYCYGLNPLNVGADPTENGQLVAILDFCCMTLLFTTCVYVGLYICILSKF